MIQSVRNMARKKVSHAQPAAGAQSNAQGAAVADRNHPATVKKELRQLFRDAFDQLGGTMWLVRFAQKDDQNARTFVQALSRLIPLELTGKDGSPLTVRIVKADGTEVELGAPEGQQPAVLGADGRLLN